MSSTTPALHGSYSRAIGSYAELSVPAFALRSRLARDEDELRRVVGQRPLVEPAVLRLDLEAGDIDEAFPLRAGRPPQADRRAVVAEDVDPVVRRGVPERVND